MVGPFVQARGVGVWEGNGCYYSNMDSTRYFTIVSCGSLKYSLYYYNMNPSIFKAIYLIHFFSPSHIPCLGVVNYWVDACYLPQNIVKSLLSEVGFEPTPTEVDCDLNAAP